MHPYQTRSDVSLKHAPCSGPPDGNTDVSAPLFLIGALGIALGCAAPTSCQLEATLGMLALLGAVKMACDDVRAQRPYRRSKLRAPQRPN